MRSKTRPGAGLVLKFSLLMIALVVVIVAGVAVPLLLRMVPREQRLLAEGLRNRAGILLESVALRAASPITAGTTGYVTVSSLPAEISAMPREALPHDFRPRRPWSAGPARCRGSGGPRLPVGDQRPRGAGFLHDRPAAGR
jgi:hypothetical protein